MVSGQNANGETATGETCRRTGRQKLKKGEWAMEKRQNKYAVLVLTFIEHYIRPYRPIIKTADMLKK